MISNNLSHYPVFLQQNDSQQESTGIGKVCKWILALESDANRMIVNKSQQKFGNVCKRISVRVSNVNRMMVNKSQQKLETYVNGLHRYQQWAG